MPSRILRDYTESFRFEHVDAETERLFVRLIQKADDFGRYHADLRMVRAGCFPMLPTVTETEISRWLDALSDAGLILYYKAGSRRFLAIINFRQRMRQMRGKFPPPDGQAKNWQALSEHVTAGNTAIDGQPSVNCPSTDGVRDLDSDLDLDLETKVSVAKATSPASAGGAAGKSAGNGQKNPALLAEITNLFHQHCPTLPKLRTMPPGRLAAIRARWKDASANGGEPLAWFEELFRTAGQSPFLTSGKKCFGFDWLMKPSNATKVMEGNYSDRRQPIPEQPSGQDGGEPDVPKAELWTRICKIVGRDPSKPRSPQETDALQDASRITETDLALIERYAAVSRTDPKRYTKLKELPHTLLADFHAEVGKARTALGAKLPSNGKAPPISPEAIAAFLAEPEHACFRDHPVPNTRDTMLESLRADWDKWIAKQNKNS